MNCRRFQDLLEEYLDDALSTGQRAVADQHLTTCDACRGALGRRRQIGSCLADGFRQLTQPLELQQKVQQRVLQGFPAISASEDPRFLSWFSGRLVWPLAAAACFLIVGFVLFLQFVGPPRSGLKSNQTSEREPAAVASIQVSYQVPTYTFRKDGSFVQDSLVYQTVVVNGQLWQEQGRKMKSKN